MESLAEQLALDLDLAEPISVTRLVAPGSPRQAYYVVEVFHAQGAGYYVRKTSGAAGARPAVETWFRPGLAGAQEKKEQLVRAKTNPRRRGRIYEIAGGE